MRKFVLFVCVVLAAILIAELYEMLFEDDLAVQPALYQATSEIEMVPSKSSSLPGPFRDPRREQTGSIAVRIYDGCKSEGESCDGGMSRRRHRQSRAKSNP